MTKIKLCGITRKSDIETINQIKPEYIGFVFAKQSKRYLSPEKAKELKEILSKDIQAVGVFVNESVETVASLLNQDTIDIAQLHGNEDEKYMETLRKLSNKPIIQAFCMKDSNDILPVNQSTADYVLLDSGAGSGKCFEWDFIKEINRPFFLAGGLNVTNVEKAIKAIDPFAVDVSSGIETNGLKDKEKMEAFVSMVRNQTI